MKMKRIALVLTLVLVLSMTATAFAASNPFADLPADHWAYDSIIQLAAVGLIEGYPDGTFGGSRMLTRYEAAMVFARALARLESLVDAGLQTGINEAEVEAVVDRILAENLDELALNDRLRKAEKRLATLSNAEGDFTTLYAMTSGLDNEVDQLNGLVAELDGEVSKIDGKIDNVNSSVVGLDEKVSQLDNKVDGELKTLYGLVSNLEGNVVELEKALDAKIIDLRNVAGAEDTKLSGLVAGFQGDVDRLEELLNAEVVNLADIFFALNNEFARELSLLGVRVEELEDLYASLDNRVDAVETAVERVAINGLVKFDFSNLQLFTGENDDKVDGTEYGILKDKYTTNLGKFDSELQLTLATKVSDSVKVNIFGSVKGNRASYLDSLDKYIVEILSETPVKRLVLGTVSDKEVKNRFDTTILDLQPTNGALADVQLGPVNVNLVGGTKADDGLVAVTAEYPIFKAFGLELAASKLLDKNMQSVDPAETVVSVGAFGDILGLNYKAALALDRYEENADKNSLFDLGLGTEIGALNLNANYTQAGENFGQGKLANKGFIKDNATSRLVLGAKANLFGIDLGVENYQEKATDKLIDGTMVNGSTEVKVFVPVKLSGKFGMMNEPDLRNATEAKVAVSGLSLFNVDLGTSYTYARNFIDGDWHNPSKWLDKDVSIVALDLGYGTNWSGADVKLGYDFKLTIPHGDTAEEFGNQTSHLLKANYGFAKDLNLNISAKQVKWTELDSDPTVDDKALKVNELKAGFEYKF